MERLTSERARKLGPPSFGWADAGYPVGEAGDELLQDRIDEQTAIVMVTTGRTLATMPVDLEPIARKAITLAVVQEALEVGSDALEVMAAPWLKSFTAGSYSETRFSPSELAAQKGQVAPGALGRLLWLLMTPEKREEFMERESGVYAPASMLREDDFGLDDPMDRVLFDEPNYGTNGYGW